MNPPLAFYGRSVLASDGSLAVQQRLGGRALGHDPGRVPVQPRSLVPSSRSNRDSPFSFSQTDDAGRMVGQGVDQQSRVSRNDDLRPLGRL